MTDMNKISNRKGCLLRVLWICGSSREIEKSVTNLNFRESRYTADIDIIVRMYLCLLQKKEKKKVV